MLADIHRVTTFERDVAVIRMVFARNDGWYAPTAMGISPVGLDSSSQINNNYSSRVWRRPLFFEEVRELGRKTPTAKQEAEIADAILP